MTTASSAPPALFGAPQGGAGGTASRRISMPVRGGALVAEARTLLDLMYDGFYMLFLLRNHHAPRGMAAFRGRVREFLSQFERRARRLDCSSEDIHDAKYAFCALLDEVILMSNFPLREEWQLQPMQLECFGDQLAGEHFFDRLELLRHQGVAKLQVLEVFHMCLLLGFQGKYLIDGSEKLGYLGARLGDELAHLRGTRPSLAPHALAPDRVAHALRTNVPAWGVASVFALGGLFAFLGLRAHLGHLTEQQITGPTQLVKLAPRAAHVTITLP